MLARPLLLLLALSPSTLAQFGPTRELTEALDRAHTTLLADLDNDGDLDVLATSWTTSLDVWYRNLGGGTFGPEQPLGEAQYTFQFAVLDLDTDGDLDIVGVSNGSQLVRLYRGLGGGAFAPGVTLAGGLGGLCGVVAADLDGDGDDDLAYASIHQGLFLQENTGGGFLPAVLLDGESAYSVTAGDVDGDGLRDLVYGSTGLDRILWKRNLGGLAFDASHVVGTSFRSPSDVDLVDLDGDLDLDLVAAGEISNKLAWFENTGGAFGPQQVLSTLSRPWSVDEADVDGDGDLDLVVAFHDGDGLAWIERTGPGFAAPVPLSTNDIGYAVDLGDVDGDGDVDLLASSWHGSLRWHPNTGGTPPFGSGVPLTKTARSARDVARADLDGDGDDDVLSASWGDGRVAWYEQLGGGAFASMVDLDADCGGCWLVRAADVDQDGDPDVLYAGTDPPAVYQLENLGGGAFGQRQLVTDDLAFPRDLELADLDGDGDLDLAVVESGATVRLFANTGGAFTPAATLGGLSNPIRLELGHLGGSGLADVVVLDWNKASVRWFRNTGGWSFAQEAAVSGFLDEPADFALTDFDGDGDLDTVWITGLFGDLSWSENLGNDTFTSGTHLATLPDGGIALSCADLDTDGDEDLLVALSWSGGIVSYDNVGGALGGMQVVSEIGDDIAATCAGDLDGDGDLDVVYPSAGTDQVLWTAAALLPALGAQGCAPGVPNSTGLPGVAFASGSAIPGDDALVLHARDLPAGKVAYFLAGLTPGLVHAPPGSVGDLCLSGVIGRLTGPGQVQTSTLAGTLSVDIGTQDIPQGGGKVAIQPGETWHFQLWHRDLVPQPVSNFTSSVGVTFR